MDLQVSLGPLRLPNPILVASGTFGYAREMAGSFDFRTIAGIVPKTVTRQPRAGNAPPRTVETASGMLNAIGLDNDGIEHFLQHHLPYLRTLATKIIVNVAGKSEQEFVELASLVESHKEGVAALELNLSCPNVAGGVDFATNPELTEKVLRQVRSVTSLPLFAKLTPNVTSVVSIAQAAEQGGADALSLINTVLGMAIDWRRRRPVLGNIFGGLSGPAIKPIALRVVYQVAAKVKLPIIGIGGITSIDDVMEFLLAGASAVQLGTVNFFDPLSAQRMVDALKVALSELKVNSVTEVVGQLHRPVI